METKKLLIFTVLLIIMAITVNAEKNSIDLNDYTIDYEYHDEDAVAGEKFTLTITVTNEENKNKTDVEFELNERYPFDVMNEADFEIGELLPYESKKKNFRIKVDDLAEKDLYSLSFDLKDDDEDYDDEIDIEIDSIIPEIIIGQIKSQPILLTPDLDDVKLTLTLENIGEGDAEYVRVKLNLPKGFKNSGSYTNLANIGILKKGENKEIDLYIDIEENIKKGLYKGELFLEYQYENSDSKTKRIYFDLPVKGKPLFEVTQIISDQEKLTPGINAQIAIEIQNIGSEKGEETSIRVFENSDQPFEFEEKTNYIGTLEPEQKGTAIFEYAIDEGANEKKYLLKIQVRTISEGNVQVSEKTIPMQIEKKQRNAYASLIVLIIALIATLGILIGIIIRKERRKQNKRKKN